MANDENQDAWDGRVRHFETRLNEVVASTERTERRVGEQIRELRAELRTETTQTRQQIVELRTEMRGQMDDMFAVLRALAAQKT